MILYDDLNYAHGRLVGTVVMYKGKPVLVDNMHGNSVQITYLLTGKAELVIYNKDFDITPVPLGNANYNGGSYYISRAPVRKDWKQGLRSTTMRCLYNGELAEVLLPSSELGKAIIGDYPTLTKAVEHLDSPKVYTMAFSRAFSLDRAMNIWHKGARIVGKLLNPETKSYTLDDKSFWARETLEEAL